MKTDRASLLRRILPDFKRRHVFATKLRLVAFAAFWTLYFYFLRDVLGQTTAVALIVLGSFFLTGVAYYYIMHERLLIPAFAVELFADLSAITAVIYLTGGPHSPYYTLYLFYAFLAGVLYNHYLSAVVAVAAAAVYGLFLLLCARGIIPPLILDYGDRLPIPTYTPAAHFLFALLFLAGIVYTVKIASYFSQQRERELEQRNRELSALNRMSATIRTATSLDAVVHRLLEAVVEGAGFTTAILVVFEGEGERARVYAPADYRQRAAIEATLGGVIDGRSLPLADVESPLLQEVRRHRIVYRRDLAELATGFAHAPSAQSCRRVQELLGVRRAVVMPLVVEEQTLGAVVGFSREPFVGEGAVHRLEAFANQSALSLEAAKLIDRLRRVNERLEEANRVKSEFLATMSHELRTPLTAIIGFAELLREGVIGEPSEEQQEGLGEVLSNAGELLEMINSLLDLTKIESGKMHLTRDRFNVVETVRRVVATATPLAQRKNQRLDVDLPGEELLLVGDEKKVQQSLLNLVANANKFTDEGGRIRIALRAHPSWESLAAEPAAARRLADVAGHFAAGGVELAVDDEGIGIRQEHLESVFEMFRQVDSSVTRSFGGTGLGLSLTRRFVELHGGRIWAESEYGEGARFRMVLPWEAPEMPDGA